MKKIQEAWEKTKEMYVKEPKMPPLPESKLRRPTFRTMLELVKCTIFNSSFAKGLFSDSELNYASYNTLEEELAFTERFLDFLEKFTSKKWNYQPLSVLRSQNEFKEMHSILQTFSKCAHSGKSSIEAVKQAKKVQIHSEKAKSAFVGSGAEKNMYKTAPLFKEEQTFKTEAVPLRKNEGGQGESEISRLKGRVEQLSREEKGKEEEINGANRGIEELKRVLDERTREIEELQAYRSKGDAVGELDKEKIRVEEELGMKQKMILDRDSEIINLEEEFKRKDAQAESDERANQKIIADLTQNNAKLRQEIDLIESDYKLRESLVLGRSKELEDKQKELVAIKNQNVALKKAVSECSRGIEIERLREESSAKSAEKDTLALENTKIRDEIAQLSASIQVQDKSEEKSAVAEVSKPEERSKLEERTKQEEESVAPEPSNPFSVPANTQPNKTEVPEKESLMPKNIAIQPEKKIEETSAALGESIAEEFAGSVSLEKCREVEKKRTNEVEKKDDSVKVDNETKKGASTEEPPAKPINPSKLSSFEPEVKKTEKEKNEEEIYEADEFEPESPEPKA